MSLRDPGSVLLLSTYELGHAPHALALASAFLQGAGFNPRVIDLSVDKLERAAVETAELIVFSTPMHTALRLSLSILTEVQSIAAKTPVAFVGHYAVLHRELLTRRGVDWVMAGELETELVRLAQSVETGESIAPTLVSTKRQSFPLPLRSGISELKRYAHFIDETGASHLAGYAETTRGCKERCRHCPVPAIYDGRFVAVDAETVLSDIAQQVEAGAKHVTFGDPDFLNGPTHALRICRELHRRWPTLTFDFTAQVANLLAYQDTSEELAELGCRFVISAVESLSDRVLEKLGKRHRAGDVDTLLDWADGIGLAIRPTLVAFTPWTTLEDIAGLADWIARRQLEHHVAPVQMSVRLLVPPGSLLLQGSEPSREFEANDDNALGHPWTHSDPRVDRLAEAISHLVSTHAGQADDEQDDIVTHQEIRRLARQACELPPAAAVVDAVRPWVPRISEPWFC